MSNVYLDSVIVIYFVEQVAPHHLAVSTRLAVPGVVPFVSDLTRMECLIKPLRRNDVVLQRQFEGLFARLTVLPLTNLVFDRAAAIRAAYNFKTPDALHLAVAVAAGCDVFLTNDPRLSRFPGLRVEVI